MRPLGILNAMRIVTVGPSYQFNVNEIILERTIIQIIIRADCIA